MGNKKEQFVEELILKLSEKYNEETNLDSFSSENVVECEFIDNLREKLDELEVEYDDVKLDYLAKYILFTYNSDKVCLLMMKKYLESPNTGKVSNERVYSQYLKSLNYNEVVLENISDSFNLKAGDFGMLERVSLCSNLERNFTLINKFGLNPNMYKICHSDYEDYVTCVKGAARAVELKNMEIKTYHKQLLKQNGKKLVLKKK